MESKAVSLIEERQRLITAANWKSASENEFGIDTMYHSFLEVMKFRREVSFRLLNSKDELEEKELKGMYEYCNDQIKKILGI